MTPFDEHLIWSVHRERRSRLQRDRRRPDGHSTRPRPSRDVLDR